MSGSVGICAIGVVEPMSVFVNTYGSGRVDDEKIANAVKKVFKLTPQGIVRSLDLLRPIYKKTATYGHFGETDFHGKAWIKLKLSKLNFYKIVRLVKKAQQPINWC